jgi:hypothetical protein
VNNYQDILNDFFSASKELFKNSTIFINKTGGEVSIPEFISVNLSDIPNEYEFPTINSIRNYVSFLNSNEPILYLHTKGVTTPGNDCISDWRNYMIYFLVAKYKECLEVLKTNDTCGVDLRKDPVLHYSGNFWWANSNYLKKLDPPENLNTPLSHRHKCEFWVCSKEGSHSSLYESNINSYERHLHLLPREKYAS